MALTTYTAYADIRAVLGVSNEELEDATLALEVYESNLTFEMEDVNASIISEYTTVSAIASGSRTDAQQRFYKAVRLFATYAVAKQLCSSLPLFGPKDVSDGKASQSRFADSPYKETIRRIEAGFDRLRGKLDEAYADLSAGSSVAVERTLFAVSSPDTDPVTGS